MNYETIQTNYKRQILLARRRLLMDCPDCYWAGNKLVRVFYPCSRHEEIELVHLYSDRKTPTLCGSFGKNITENVEDITCPECQIGVLNYYVLTK